MVEQTARQLAEELINCEYGKAFKAAKQAYDADFEAQAKLNDYVRRENMFQQRLIAGDVSEEEKAQYYDEIDKLNVEIRSQGTSGALFKAESEFNEYIQSVMNIIMTAVQNEMTPEQAGGCSGSCGSCAGCH